MGNRSSTHAPPGVARRSVRLPGVIVRADICIPKAHAHAAWVLPWVEGLLSGRTLADLSERPPWPAPPDPVLARHLRHTLLDLGWALPDWATGEVRVAPALAEAWAAEGRRGLARVLFEADVHRGEWWAEGLAGTLLSRQTAAQFDWDRHQRPDETLEIAGDPLALVEASEPDLPDLLRKLGGVELLWEGRDHAFLASPFVVEEPKDILFTLVGEAPRLLPPELAELEPVLLAHAPGLLGTKRASASRVVRLARSPVEQIAADVERLPADPVPLGPIGPVRTLAEALGERVGRLAPELVEWLREGHVVRPVVGPTQRHFDAVAEVCAGLAGTPSPILLLTSAFLNVKNADRDGGLADAFAEAPADARFLVVYGHASDDLPAQQRNDMDAWLAAMVARAPGLTGRLAVVAGKRRSHEKVLVSSAGDWMVGSWNASSSAPHATVVEASLAGRDPRLAGELLARIAENVEEAGAVALVEAMGAAFERLRPTPVVDPEAAVEVLRRACGVLAGAVPEDDGTRAEAWPTAVRALRAALAPFVAATRVDILDEHQTRDAFLTHARAARRDVLLASDRLADSALDPATLRDLRGDGRTTRIVRVVWGREWAGRAPSDRQARDQLRRARDTVREARNLLGDSLRTSDAPMENHAKLLVVDGRRGILTSENLLSYGGEKGRYESRELGLAFWSPVVARHLVGRLLYQWPAALGAAGEALPWAVLGNEAWHALAPMGDELDFDWQAPSYIAEVVASEITEDEGEEVGRRAAWDALSRAPDAFAHVREEASRLGLVQPGDAWRPWDAPAEPSVLEVLGAAERAVAALPPRPARRSAAADSLVARVLADMVRIPAGSFWMGDDRVPEERPRHRVHITRPFLLGRTPVTQGLWFEVMGWLPHLRDCESHATRPIVQVTRAQMDEFVARLNALAGDDAFELPTEAQWEYACRAGADTDYCFGDDPGGGDEPGRLEDYAWTKRNSGAQSHPVGQREPNRFGLYDMHGLVYETVRDPRRVYTRAEVRDPVGAPGEGPLVARGGCWSVWPLRGGRAGQHFRCASRQLYEKSHRVSFRIARRIEVES